MSFIVKITETDGDITIQLIDFEKGSKCTIKNDTIQKGEIGSIGWLAKKVLESFKESFRGLVKS